MSANQCSPSRLLLVRVLELTHPAWDLELFARDKVDGSWESGVGNRESPSDGLAAYIARCANPTPNSPHPTPSSFPPFRRDEARRFLLRVELDAAFFHLFGLNRDDTAYILDTVPIVRRKDEAKDNGEYKTRTTILEIYDALSEFTRTGQPYQTRLDPPPADPRVAHPPKGSSS